MMRSSPMTPSRADTLYWPLSRMASTIGTSEEFDEAEFFGSLSSTSIVAEYLEITEPSQTEQEAF